ncbi:hypothetical protein EAG_10832 [Camponotus floridanus]|uniref:Uncharacterized protein n=1 Tax=Camponotus floridanus TaxID=104421 RepID=E2AG28_CAMFO|nr:hypothetical protein EAG_10832 [Camponotus floridanus]
MAEVIIIDDDDYDMDPIVAERMKIEREEREMDISDHELSDEDWSDNEILIEPLTDSDYNSDDSDDSMMTNYGKKKQRHLELPEILTLNETLKICCISWYYEENEENSKYCPKCFIQRAFLFVEAKSVREHRTTAYCNIEDISCRECRKSLHQVMPCDMCPVCKH